VMAKVAVSLAMVFSLSIATWPDMAGIRGRHRLVSADMLNCDADAVLLCFRRRRILAASGSAA
jgi:hypothetical protein